MTAAAQNLMVNIGKFSLHAVLSGQGAPVVVFEPALGGFALQYELIQAEVATFTRVLAYDRAGQADSDTSPYPRTPSHLASELRDLLAMLELQPPYVLVGHSFGGLLARNYAGFHPADVAGVVLVDSSHEDQHGPAPDLDKMLRQTEKMLRVYKFFHRLGLGRPLARLSLGKGARSLPKDALRRFVAVASQPKHQDAMLAEYKQHSFYFGARTVVPKTLGDIPLVVVTAEKSISGSQMIAGMTADEMNARHQRLQKELVKLSSRGEQVVVPGATHLSILFRPDHAAQVTAAIRRVVELARG